MRLKQLSDELFFIHLAIVNVETEN